MTVPPERLRVSCAGLSSSQEENEGSSAVLSIASLFARKCDVKAMQEESHTPLTTQGSLGYTNL